MRACDTSKTDTYTTVNSEATYSAELTDCKWSETQERYRERKRERERTK